MENCYDKPIDLRETLDRFNLKTVSNEKIINDVEIILTDNLNDKQLKQSINIDEIIIKIICKGAPKDESGNIDEQWLIKEAIKQIRGQKWQHGNQVTISYNKAPQNKQGVTNEEWLINKTLNLLSESGLFVGQQESYLRELADVFIEEDYFTTSILLGYASVLKNQETSKYVIEKQDKFIKKTAEKWYKNKKNIYMGYAAARATYVVNKLCKDSDMALRYSYEETIDIADELKNLGGGLLSKSILPLKLQTNYFFGHDFLGPISELQATLLNENRLNTFAHHLLGVLFRNHTRKSVSHHFRDAISIFPANYESWYEYGNCLLKENNEEGARIAFSTAIKILNTGDINRALNSKEKIIFCRSAIAIGKFFEARLSYENALIYYGYAKQALTALKDSYYLKELSRNINNRDIIEILGDRLDEHNLVKRIDRCKDYLGKK